MKNLWLAGLLLLLSMTGALANPQSKKTTVPAPAPFGNIEGITATQMKDYLEFIASEKPSLGFDNPVKPATPDIPVAIASPGLLAALFQGEQSNGATIYGKVILGEPLAGFELNANKTLTLQIAAQNEAVSTRNIVAVLEGSDPLLKNEYVAIGAHYDHIGVGTLITGDAINNGADDGFHREN